MFPVIICRLCTQRSIQVIRYFDLHYMGVGIIRYALSASALRHLIGVRLACVLRGKFNFREFKGSFITFGRSNRNGSRIRQFPSISAGHREGELIPFLELTAGDDLLSFDLGFGGRCCVSVGKFQMFSIVIGDIRTQRSIQVICYFNLHNMSVGIICYPVSASALCHLISVGLTCVR